MSVSMEKKKIINEFLDAVLLCKTSSHKLIASYYRIQQKIFDIGARFQIYHTSDFTGSMFEGLPAEVCSDEDSMITYRDFPLVKLDIKDHEFQSNEKSNIVFAQTISENAAFVKLKTYNKDDIELIVSHSINDEGFINGKILVESLRFDEDVIHGPAMTSHIYEQYPSVGKRDNVPALFCPKWPSLYSTFGSRFSASGWPTVELREKIVLKGCHLVPVGIPASSTKDIEWRWSFSVAEKELIHHMDQSMYTCMFALKAIKQKHWVANESWSRNPFVSYFLKTTCLWLCEELDCTEMKITELIGLVIDKLKNYYSDHYLPHYFIPEQNLIGNLDSDICKHVVNWLDEVKKDFFVKCLSSIEIDGQLEGVFDGIMVENDISCLQINDRGEYDFAALFTFFNENENAKNVLLFLNDQIKPGGRCYIFDYRLKLGEYSTFSDDSISFGLMKYKEYEADDVIFAIPDDILLEIIEDIESIVFEPYVAMYKQSLYRYLGRLYSDVSSYLFERNKDLSLKSYQKAVKYYQVGKVMTHHNGWSDEGFVGMVNLIMCYYLNQEWLTLAEVLEEFKPLLDKALVDADWRNGFADIPVFKINHLNPIPWQKGDNQIYSKLVSRVCKYYSYLILLDPTLFTLYVIARNSIRQGQYDNAKEAFHRIKAFQEEETPCNEQNEAIGDVLIEIIENLLTAQSNEKS